MAYDDPVKKIISILNEITIPGVTPGDISIFERYSEDFKRQANGQIYPTYTVFSLSAPTRPMDINDNVSIMDMTLQIDVWCQQYGTYNDPIVLNEAMVNEVRKKIKEYKNAPTETIRQLSIIDEADRTEADGNLETNPLIRRKLIPVRAVCFRT